MATLVRFVEQSVGQRATPVAIGITGRCPGGGASEVNSATLYWVGNKKKENVP